MGHKLRLNTPTLGIHTIDGQRSTVSIPSGALITVPDGRLDNDRTISVDWEGKTVLMFAIDLRKRGTPVD